MWTILSLLAGRGRIGDALGGLMTEWHAVFGSAPTTVRKAVEATHNGHPNLLDAMGEFPIEAHGIINRRKLGWLLKLNANRIVGGLEFQKAEAEGSASHGVIKAPVRKLWQIGVEALTEASSPSSHPLKR